MQTEKRIYVIVPRNLDIPGDKPQKMTVTCGAQGGYTGHATALLQRKLFLEVIFDKNGLLNLSLDREERIRGVLDVSFQLILTLMVPNSHALDDAMFWLAQNNIRYWTYKDEDKKFPGQIPAAVITEPLDEERAAVLRAYKPWRCECNSVHAKSTERKDADAKTATAR